MRNPNQPVIVSDTEIPEGFEVVGHRTITVCFNCKRGDRMLRRIRDGQGRKTKDYICTMCLSLGFTRPEVQNVSWVRIPLLEKSKSKNPD